ncbi:hypothetical protein HYP85_gp096 [Pseudomonas phage Zuri]|uniref:Structural protein n=1 Tax=Pseudomonas phage Zuri TaxID=2604899 RepID=A0A5C1K5D5_9CAUD|nr:hypothetical protein HYP85_gp096 [Pseudomonas phage Zuri]QEM41170.1 structural protein [Pseudomonas phage Zuri]
MLTIQDIQSQLASLFSGGNYQGNGATTFAAPSYTSPEVVGNTASFMGGGNTTGLSVPQGTPNATDALSGTGFGMNIPTAGLALGGLQALTGLIQGNKAMKLASDQFKFTKDITNTNLNNQIKSYNTALTDRLTSRAVAQGMSNEERDRLIAANSLSR